MVALYRYVHTMKSMFHFLYAGAHTLVRSLIFRHDNDEKKLFMPSIKKTPHYSLMARDTIGYGPVKQFVLELFASII